jgi:hypothetical protein
MSSDFYYSKTKFVAKDVTTARTISMERNDVMLFQQAILSAMVRSFSRGLMIRYVTLHDQSTNQRFARYGSETGFLDTIDLSSASDRVGVDLVKKIFPTSWLIPLMATRSSFTKLPNGSKIKVKKFAPMGSALCFPIQCIIFTAITLLAYKRFLVSTNVLAGDDNQSDFNSLIDYNMSRYPSDEVGYHTHRLQPITIYGDDIICDSRTTGIVVELLSTFGFEVNQGKSFTGGQSVRESCGKYYNSGEDITPLRFRPSFFNDVMNATAFESLIAFANNCYSYGFLNVRSYVINLLRNYKYPTIRPGVKGVNLPFTTDPNMFGIFVPRRKSYSYVRFNNDLQFHEELVLSTKRRKQRRESSNLEAYLYFRAQSRPTSAQPSDLENKIASRSRLGDTQFAKRWTPLRN